VRHIRRLLGATSLATAAAGALALAVGPVTGPVPAAGQATPGPGGQVRVILRLDPSVATGAAGVEAALRRGGGRVLAAQPALAMLVGELPATSVPALRSVPGVVGVTPDSALPTLSLGYDPAGQPGSMTNVTRVTGATTAWQKGFTGDGVDVAVIDTGIAPVPALAGADKVVVGPDLSFESQSGGLRYLDTYGHGTHMAGIIAGREMPRGTGASYAADRTNFYGMAPDARLVSLKLADHDGAVDVSQVVAAINWVVARRHEGGTNIRVLNLSFGTQSPQSAVLDPLSWAAEAAWHAGIVVVASGGNDAGRYAGLANPAYNPWVIAVGAADTRGTDGKADDEVPGFSARQDGTARGVDLVAPGVGIVSAGVPGSKLYETYPAARVGNRLLRGSGTSQAAAVVSGAAALLLDRARPG
jgi:serine protease AprX